MRARGESYSDVIIRVARGGAALFMSRFMSRGLERDVFRFVHIRRF